MNPTRPYRTDITWHSSPTVVTPFTLSSVVVYEITDVPLFLQTLPDEYKPPTQIRPESGLPKNVWVGGFFHYVWPEILDVRSRVRFLIIDASTDLVALEAALDAWRCSNCGHRGVSPRPIHCPHLHLCGDAKLMPQIHWVVDLAHVAPGGDVEVMTKHAGAVYWPGEFPRVD